MYRLAPAVLAAADVLGEIDHRAAVDPELLERLVEHVGDPCRSCFCSTAFSTGSARRRPKMPSSTVTSGIVALEEEIVRAPVGVGVHQDRAARQPVAAGAADLLVVGLEAARQRRVDHGAHVGLVDAHAERDGRDHHLDAAVEELLLHALAVLRVEARVVGAAGEMRGELARPARSACARVGA